MFRISRLSSAALTGLRAALLNGQVKAVSKTPAPHMPRVPTSTLVSPTWQELLLAPSLYYVVKQSPPAPQEKPVLNISEVTALLAEFNAAPPIDKIEWLLRKQDRIIAIASSVQDETDSAHPLRHSISAVCTDLAKLLRVTPSKKVAGNKDEKIRALYQLAIKLDPTRTDLQSYYGLWRAWRGEKGEDVPKITVSVWASRDEDAPPKAKP